MRKYVDLVEDARVEKVQPVCRPVSAAAAIAVVKNPFASS
jgi:hypothetical protein